MSELLRTNKLSKNFSDGENTIHVLHDIDFSVSSGDSLAIIGPSGSGKSTLLHLLAGLDTPSSGNIVVKDKLLTDYNENQKCKLRNEFFGFVYQHHHLLKDFTVLENIIMPCIIKGEDKQTAIDRAKDMLKQVDLLERINFNVNKLSGGEKQRVAILRALINNPKILFADEPTGNLCQETAQDVYKTMLELHQQFNSALVLVTHDLSLANKMQFKYYLKNGVLTKQ